MNPRRVVDRALTVAAVLGVVCLALTVLAPMMGVRLLVFRSGSMEPTIATGAIGVVLREPVGDVHVGDVVTVTAPGGARVTHRVVGTDGRILRLQGDANAAPDPQPYRPSTVDRLVAHVPLVGYVVGWATSGVGLLALTLLGAALLLLVLRPQLLAPEAMAPKSRHRRARARVGPTAALVVTVTGLVLLGPAQVRPGWSAWGDEATISAGYAAVTVAAPTLSCGTLQTMSTALTWTPVAGATGYRLHYGIAGATTETVGPAVTSKTFTSIGTGTFWAEAERTSGGNTWRSVVSNTKRYTVVLGAVGTCFDG